MSHMHIMYGYTHLCCSIYTKKHKHAYGYTHDRAVPSILLRAAGFSQANYLPKKIETPAIDCIPLDVLEWRLFRATFSVKAAFVNMIIFGVKVRRKFQRRAFIRHHRRALRKVGSTRTVLGSQQLRAGAAG